MGIEKRSGVVTRTLKVDISPEECAAAFLDMDSDQQAEVINLIGRTMCSGDVGWGVQLGWLCGKLDAFGKEFVRDMEGWL